MDDELSPGDLDNPVNDGEGGWGHLMVDTSTVSVNSPNSSTN